MKSGRVSSAAGGWRRTKRWPWSAFFSLCVVTSPSTKLQKYFRLASELGDPDAQQDLAFCLANGKGCKKDRKEAAKWYRAAVRTPSRCRFQNSRKPSSAYRSLKGPATSGWPGYTRRSLCKKAVCREEKDQYHLKSPAYPLPSF